MVELDRPYHLWAAHVSATMDASVGSVLDLLFSDADGDAKFHVAHVQLLLTGNHVRR